MAPGVRDARRAGMLVILALATPAVAKRPVCRDGRFVQATPILPGTAPRPSDAVVVKDGELSIESGCPPAPVHEKASRTGGTRLNAKWKACGTLHHVRFTGRAVGKTSRAVCSRAANDCIAGESAIHNGRRACT